MSTLREAAEEIDRQITIAGQPLEHSPAHRALRSALAHPPPPDYVLGQEDMRERAANAVREEIGDFGGLAAGIRSLPLEAASEGTAPAKPDDPVRYHEWVRDGMAELPGREVNRCLRCGVRVVYEPALGRIRRVLCTPPAPAAQTTTSPGTGSGEKGTCRACGGYGWVGSIGGDPNIGPEPCPACSDPPDAGHNEGEGR